MIVRVLIVASSKFPVPAVKGGAVPNLIEEIINENEKEKQLDIVCCSLYDKEAEKQSKRIKNTQFIWSSIPKFITKLDKIFYCILKDVFHIQRLISLSFLFQVIWFSLSVAKVLKRNSFDKVIFENSIPVMFAMKLYGNKKKYKDKYLLHIHSVPRKYYGNKRIVRNCESLICISEYVANAILNDKRLKFDASKIRIMYNCIDTHCFKPLSNDISEKVRERYNISKNKKVILFAGRLCADKGIAELLLMTKEIKRDDIILLVVGSNFYKSDIVSPYEKYLRQLCEDIKEKIIFTGYVNYNEMPKIYAAADVVALPSMWEEPAGMTIIEAMACAKPVVTTYSGGIPEYTGEGNCVLLHRDKNVVKNLEKTIVALVEDQVKAEELSEKAHIRAMKYNQKYYYSQLLDILK